MTDYAALKVDELKKLLSDRGLPLSGKKADLVSRLQENDAAASKPEAKSTLLELVETKTGRKGDKCTSGTSGARQDTNRPPTGNEDEIDWDDEKPAESAPAAAAAPAAAPAAEAPAAPAAAAPASAAPADASTNASAATPAEEPIAVPAASTIDIEEELRRREARAKRFGITTAAADESKELEDEDAKKAAERAARFGIDPAAAAKNKEIDDAKNAILSSLDTALPDRPLKRGRGGGDGDRRDNKRSTPDRRHGNNNRNRHDNRNNNNRNNNRNNNNDRRGNNNNNKNGGGGGGGNRGPKGLNFLSDPAEKKKAEERAKRFGL